MAPSIEVLDIVVKRLYETKRKCLGTLYGTILKNKVLVVGFKVEDNTSEQPSNSAVNIFNFNQVVFPSGIDLIGVVAFEEENEDMKPLVIEKLHGVSVTNTPIYIRKDLKTDALEVHCMKNKTLTLVERFEELSFSNYEARFITVRITGEIPVEVRTKMEMDGSLQNAVNNCRISESGSDGMLFQVGLSDMFIRQKNSSQSTIGSVFNTSPENTGKDFRTSLVVLNIIILNSTTVNNPDNITAPFSIESEHKKPEAGDAPNMNGSCTRKVRIPIDTLCVLPRDKSLDQVYSSFIDAVERTLSFAECELITNRDGPQKMEDLITYHFFPQAVGHPFSIISLERDFDKLESLRKSIHDNLCIPPERPYFRKANALHFMPNGKLPFPLINVHEGVRNSKMKSPNSLSAFVYGSYHYYHYKLNNMNDSGWGCAYRSLQTIFSWFILQGYTSKEVPSHLAIQEALVALGDKDKQFIGSNTWIGSTEVSYYLDVSLNVQSRLVNLQTGSEMSTLGPMLVDHFSTQGTPIMIGGGVLAHTIIGVDFDPNTQEIYFLILDPHYTGDHELKTIQSKGFVGWKGVEFWDKNSFYNLCFPLRPICF